MAIAKQGKEADRENQGTLGIWDDVLEKEKYATMKSKEKNILANFGGGGETDVADSWSNPIKKQSQDGIRQPRPPLQWQSSLVSRSPLSHFTHGTRDIQLTSSVGSRQSVFTESLDVSHVLIHSWHW